MAQETELLDSVTVRNPEFYSGLRDSFVSNPENKTYLITAGLTGSGKTTLVGQLFYKLLQDSEVIDFCKATNRPFPFYYHSFGQGISYAKTKHPDQITTPAEPFEPREYTVVSATMKDLVSTGHEFLPNPAFVVFDSVNITAVLNQDNQLEGVDRGTSVAKMIAQEHKGFSAAIASPLQLRELSLTTRDRIRAGEDPIEVLTTMGIQDAETDPVKLRDLYSKTGTWASLDGNDRHLNELMFNLIARGELPPPSFDLQKPEDFMSDQFQRMVYLKNHFYPLWNARLYQRVANQGFTFQNSSIRNSISVHSDLVNKANLINALQEKNLI